MRKRKKIKKKKLVIIFSIIIILLSILIYVLVCKKDIFTYRDKIVIEVGENIPTVSDYLYKSNDKVKDIVWIDDFEDTKIYKTGTYKGTFTYKNKIKEVTLIVKDTKSPIISGVKDIEVIAFLEKPDLLKEVTVTDNSNEDIKIEIKGDYDIEVAGDYKLSYTAKDSSGNEVVKEFKVVVKDNPNVKISKTKKGNTIKNYYGITYIDEVVVVNKSYGLPSNFSPNNLVTINGYIEVVDYVKEAFSNLASDATSIGLNIYASSGYRSYNNQNYIYNNYVKKDGVKLADTYSARAGYSEHQTGLAIDVNTIDMTFDNTNESNWLKENCYKYGFIIRYPKGKEEITGYMYEPWHIRYVGKDMASKLYNNGAWVTLEEYFGVDSRYEE